VPPWPPPFKPIGGNGGVADFMPQATIQQELESRVTQMQEGEDDVDIPAMDTTIPMGQQAYMTRDRAYMLNPQVNLSLAVCTYCSQNLILLNHDDGLLIFRSMGDEPAKCEGASSKFGPGGRSDNIQLGPAFRTTRLDLQEVPD